MINIADLPIWSLVAAFALSAGAVWIAGTRLSRYADGIAALPAWVMLS
jgi:cation:H+ antiporter